ncbi:MAG: MipA/OmpV family protein [Planctomycetes bacterium]|nr:MipA/OmpV family protein [Planctomycetota bacterium]
MANKILIISLTLLICSAALAEVGKQNSQTDPNSMFLLGPGALITVKPYKGMDSTVYPIPVITAVSAPFYFWIDTAGCRLFSDSNMAFDVIGKWRLDGYDADKSDDFEGMHDRNMTVDVGGEFSVTGDWGNLYARILTDALGQHDGQEFRVTYAKPFKFEKSKISPSVGFALLSSNLADYYYGVRDDEARAGRPAYNPGASVNWFVGLDADYQLNDDWTLLTSITYYWLDSDIRNSPIANKDYTISIIAGAMYRF